MELESQPPYFLKPPSFSASLPPGVCVRQERAQSCTHPKISLVTVAGRRKRTARVARKKRPLRYPQVATCSVSPLSVRQQKETTSIFNRLTPAGIRGGGSTREPGPIILKFNKRFFIIPLGGFGIITSIFADVFIQAWWSFPPLLAVVYTTRVLLRRDLWDVQSKESTDSQSEDG